MPEADQSWTVQPARPKMTRAGRTVTFAFDKLQQGFNNEPEAYDKSWFLVTANAGSPSQNTEPSTDELLFPTR